MFRLGNEFAKGRVKSELNGLFARQGANRLLPPVQRSLPEVPAELDLNRNINASVENVVTLGGTLRTQNGNTQK